MSELFTQEESLGEEVCLLMVSGPLDNDTYMDFKGAVYKIFDKKTYQLVSGA